MMPSALKDALGKSGGRLAGAQPGPKAEPAPIAAEVAVPAPARPARQPSRENTVALTVHFPEPVRRQVKVLASEEGRNVDDMVAEALNLLFARYRKPEIAPRKAAK